MLFITLGKDVILSHS